MIHQANFTQLESANKIPSQSWRFVILLELQLSSKSALSQIRNEKSHRSNWKDQAAYPKMMQGKQGQVEVPDVTGDTTEALQLSWVAVI